KPDRKRLGCGSHVNRKRSLQSHKLTADSFGKKHHVAVVGRRETDEIIAFKILCRGDYTANPVRRIDRETEHCAPLHHRDAWIVDPLDELRTETSRIQMPHSRPGLFLIEHGLRM